MKFSPISMSIWTGWTSLVPRVMGRSHSSLTTSRHFRFTLDILLGKHKDQKSSSLVFEFVFGGSSGLGCFLRGTRKLLAFEGTRTLNKMTKGAIATAAGVMLLIGGGGTLAVWNIEKNAAAGTVAAGDLNLVADTGVWTVNGQAGTINIDAYRIVPGDTLTYTQDVDITLEGNISATLAVVQPSGANHGFAAYTYETSAVTLTKDGAPITGTLTAGVTDAVASVSFKFLPETAGRDSAGATYDFSGVAFRLEQIAPAAPA